MNHLLLVEDEPNFGAILRDYLSMNGFTVTLCTDGEAGWQAFRAQPTFALCILDVMMPIKDGFTLAQDIRKIHASVPILFLTARSQRDDRLHGLRIGADDYLTKPFDAEELLLRIHAILRRAAPVAPAATDKVVFTIGSYTFDYSLRTVSRQGEEARLSPREAELLKLLCTHQNALLPREAALRTLWGDDNYFNGRSMDVFLTRLRQRLREDASIHIENIHGKGYRLWVA